MLSFMPQILYVLKSKLLPVFVGMALCLSAFSPAAAAEISSLRIGQGIGNIRVVFDADSKFDYKVFLLTEPRRLVIDTQNVSVNPKIEKVVEPNSSQDRQHAGNSNCSPDAGVPMNRKNGYLCHAALHTEFYCYTPDT